MDVRVARLPRRAGLRRRTALCPCWKGGGPALDGKAVRGGNADVDVYSQVCSEVYPDRLVRSNHAIVSGLRVALTAALGT
jgi:hypothetical protein